MLYNENMIYIILIILGAILYRMGGREDYDTLWRDIGVPLISLLSMIILNKYHWSLLLCMPLMYASLTTYWKRTPDANWFNWFLHGFMIGFAFLPYGIMTHTLLWVGIRALFMGLFMAIWCEIFEDVLLEEGARGGITVATLCML
jgi:hypothetical protein